MKNALYPLYSVARLLGRLRGKDGQTGTRAAGRNRNTRGVPGRPRLADEGGVSPPEDSARHAANLFCAKLHACPAGHLFPLASLTTNTEYNG